MVSNMVMQIYLIVDPQWAIFVQKSSQALTPCSSSVVWKMWLSELFASSVSATAWAFSGVKLSAWVIPGVLIGSNWNVVIFSILISCK